MSNAALAATTCLSKEDGLEAFLFHDNLDAAE
jgi:hypothetical protein